MTRGSTYRAVQLLGSISPGKCVSFDENSWELTLSNFQDSEDESEIVLYRNIARVLDGQHRLAGLENMDEEFDLNVSIFVDADIADQASIFSTVNLAQTKVNKSLAYDLYDLMKSRSPQKSCHNIAVTLDREEGSPFYKMIKRLGMATEGRKGETLTQATFIEPLLRYISANPMGDRDTYLRGKTPKKVDYELLSKHPFQHMFVDAKDFQITDIVWNYFDAVREKWPASWNSRDKGIMLNRTNGYRAFMRFLRPLYLRIATPGEVPSKESFLEILNNTTLTDEDFNVRDFAPGSTGEGELYRTLMAQTETLEPKNLRQTSMI